MKCETKGCERPQAFPFAPWALGLCEICAANEFEAMAQEAYAYEQQEQQKIREEVQRGA